MSFRLVATGGRRVVTLSEAMLVGKPATSLGVLTLFRGGCKFFYS